MIQRRKGFAVTDFQSHPARKNRDNDYSVGEWVIVDRGGA